MLYNRCTILAGVRRQLGDATGAQPCHRRHSLTRIVAGTTAVSTRVDHETYIEADMGWLEEVRARTGCFQHQGYPDHPLFFGDRGRVHLRQDLR